MDYVYLAAGAVAYGLLEWFTGITAKVKGMVKPQDGPPPPPPPKQ